MAQNNDLNWALKLNYMKRVKISLDSVGAWPREKFGQKPSWNPFKNAWFLYGVSCSGLFMAIMYIKLNFHLLDFFVLGHSYITTLMNACGIQRLATSRKQTYRNMTKDFVQKIHLCHHKQNSDYAMKIYNKVHKMSDIFTTVLHLQMYSGIFLFNLMPLYNNYKMGMFGENRPADSKFEHSIYFQMPFDFSYDFKGYLALFFFNWYMSYLCSVFFCIYDLLLSIKMFHLWGHLQILEYNLQHFPPPANSTANNNDIRNPAWYSEEEIPNIMRMIKDNVEHHKMITDFMNQISNAWGFTIGLYYSFHQISGCVLLLECSTMEPKTLMKYGPLTLILFQQLIQLSICFELVSSKSDVIKDAAYNMPWECMPTKARPIIHFFLCNVQEAMTIKAFKMVPVGVQTMSAILKNSFSYFIMLRTVAAKDNK